MSAKDQAEKDETYNGWRNWETWNVALWIENDEGLYRMAREYRRKGYLAFAAAMEELRPAEIAWKTPDGALWRDSGLDVEALDQMLEEL